MWQKPDTEWLDSAPGIGYGDTGHPNSLKTSENILIELFTVFSTKRVPLPGVLGGSRHWTSSVSQVRPGLCRPHTRTNAVSWDGMQHFTFAEHADLSPHEELCSVSDSGPRASVVTRKRDSSQRKIALHFFGHRYT